MFHEVTGRNSTTVFYGTVATPTALRLNLIARFGASAMTGLHTPRYRFAAPSLLIMSCKMPSMEVVLPPDSCCRVFATCSQRNTTNNTVSRYGKNMNPFPILETMCSENVDDQKHERTGNQDKTRETMYIQKLTSCI